MKLVRNYRSTPQVVAWPTSCCRAPRPGRRRRWSPCRRSGAAGPAPSSRPTPTTRPRRPASRGRSPALIAEGTPPSQIAVLYRTNGQSEALRVGPGRRRASPTCVRGGERFFARKEVRQAVLLLRGAARGDDGSKPLGELVRDVLGGAGWTRAAAGQRRGGPRALGVAAGAGPAGRRRWSRPPRRPRLPELVARARRAGRRRSTHRPCRASRWPRCTRPRAWSGTAVFLVGLREGLMPISHGRRPGRGGGGAPAALRRHDPGPASTCGCRGPAPATPAAAAHARPSRFLDGLRPACSARGPLRAEVGRTPSRRRGQAGQGRRAGAVPHAAAST